MLINVAGNRADHVLRVKVRSASGKAMEQQFHVNLSQVRRCLQDRIVYYGKGATVRQVNEATADYVHELYEPTLTVGTQRLLWTQTKDEHHQLRQWPLAVDTVEFVLQQLHRTHLSHGLSNVMQAAAATSDGVYGVALAARELFYDFDLVTAMTMQLAEHIKAQATMTNINNDERVQALSRRVQFAEVYWKSIVMLGWCGQVPQASRDWLALHRSAHQLPCLGSRKHV